MYQKTITLSTKGFTDITDITDELEKAVQESGRTDGLAVVFVPGSTAAVTTIENEPGVIEDFKRTLEKLVPSGIEYLHNQRWGDGNGFSHVRAALLGPSLSIPFRGSTPLLGTWQQVVVVDFDNRPRNRKVVFQIL